MQCRPAPVSSRQDSGVAGPEKGVLYKHKNRIFLICSCRVIICYLLNVLLWGTHLSYRQCRPPPVSSKQDSGRAGPEKSLLYKHKSRISADRFMQSYDMLSIKPSYRECSPKIVV